MAHEEQKAKIDFSNAQEPPRTIVSTKTLYITSGQGRQLIHTTEL